MTKVLIVEARFYDDLADELVQGATEFCTAKNIEVEKISVPGCFEIPGVIAAAHRNAPGKYDGFIALGVVVRGETTHYDYVCGESARGLMDLSVGQGLAIGYGILTVENRDQAWARARISEGNKGAAAADACVCMIDVNRQFKEG